MKVLVTVGTTSFEELVQRMDDEEVRQALNSIGYQEIVIQIGRGLYKPRFSKFFEYEEEFDKLVESADLVICHAGAGSILSGVKKQKKVIAVVNSHLQDNHQEELGIEMARLGHILYSRTPSDLIKAIKQLPDFEPVPLVEASTNQLNNDIQEALLS